MSQSEVEKKRKDELRQSQSYKETKEILGKLFQNATVLGDKIGAFLPTRYEIFKRNCMEFYEKWKEAQEISEILRGLKSDVNYNNDRLKSMSKMLAYLGLVESLGITLMDVALIFLIANGKEVHTRGPLIKHVTSFEELKDLDLGYKLEFLKDERLNLFKEFINKDVRDHIAHLKFKIKNNGEIRKIEGSPIHIAKEIAKFWDGVDTMKLVFEDIGFLKWLEVKRNSFVLNVRNVEK